MKKAHKKDIIKKRHQRRVNEKLASRKRLRFGQVRDYRWSQDMDEYAPGVLDMLTKAGIRR
jgi:hypothetical protein